jgi:hypothetical protein
MILKKVKNIIYISIARNYAENRKLRGRLLITRSASRPRNRVFGWALVTVLMKYQKIVGRPHRRSHRRVWVRSYLRKQRAAGVMRGIMNELSETHPAGFINYRAHKL